MPEHDQLPWPPYSRLDPTGFAISPDGLGIAFYDLCGVGPPLLLVHATGFCAAVLSPIASSLQTKFHCFAMDLRAHGRSGRPEDGNLGWDGFARDVGAVVEALGLQSPAGFGHSCGGASLLLAEESRPGTFRALHCYEPVVIPSDVPVKTSPEADPLSAGAMRRRRSFSSREEALSNFSAKPPFDRIRRDVLALYVDNGFAPAPDGNIDLRCRREDEAQVYAGSFSHDAYARLHLVHCRVSLSCGELTDGFGPEMLSMLAARLEHSNTSIFCGLGHFDPLENPETVAASLADDLAVEAR